MMCSNPFSVYRLPLALIGLIASPSASALSTAPQRMTAATRMSATAANGSVNAGSQQQLKVAIIGAGAAGLTAARQFARRGIEPVVLEKDSIPGGVWSYRENAPDRPMYRGLRTNLPRELMAYREKPWGGDGATKSYVTHRQVWEYLGEYSKEFGLQKYVRYGCKVCQLTVQEQQEDSPSSSSSAAVVPDAREQPWPTIKLEWEVTKSEGGDIATQSDIFDAVCICNGHYAKPSSPTIPGLNENYKGKTMHSVEYDDPAIFAGKTVLCVGGRASGSDLAREISHQASKVYLSDSACKPLEDGKPRKEGNVHWVPRTMSVDKDGSIHFEGCNEAPADVDVIIFCSGYDYQFPFINDKSKLDVSCVPGERRVAPLYEQLWHARYPNLSFVGLQHSVVPFPFFEFQMQAVVANLVGEAAVPLPNMEDRLKAAQADADSGGPNDPGRVEDTHFLGSYQWDACRNYAKIAGMYDEATENFIATNKAIYDHSGMRRKGLFPGGPDTYREDLYVRQEGKQRFQVQLAEADAATLEDAHA